VSSSVIPIRRRKKISDITNSMELNLLSHQRFIKNATTISAFTEAIPMATTIFQGAGKCTQLAATVMNVRKKRAEPMPHKNLAEEIWCPLMAGVKFF